jgi:Protein of unknown function (DUF3306)
MSGSSRGREGFLQRWSRRKAGIAPAADEALAAAATPVTTRASRGTFEPAAVDAPDEASAPTAAGAGAAVPSEPLPTIADVAALTPGADVTRFMRTGVDGAVRNAALKKLFSDPRFNVMDGLDTYIDDYRKPDPLPLDMLRRMQQSAALGLFESVANVCDPNALEGAACPDGAVPRAVAQLQTLPPPPGDAEPHAEDDPDLRLQSDDADRRPGVGADPRR